jgi:dTDP-4-dehydrorhamnose 3,5-epimerase
MNRLEIKTTSINDLYIIGSNPIYDDRGYFERLFCEEELRPILKKPIKQINHSLTKNKGSIRGMHYQIPPAAETKIIKCIKGSIYDVAVDLRKDSPTFLKWHGEIISEGNSKMFLIPEGFAHGFQTLDDNIEVIYFTTEYYSVENERGARFNDPLINIKWPLKFSESSERDKNFPFLGKNFNGLNIL